MIGARLPLLGRAIAVHVSPVSSRGEVVRFFPARIARASLESALGAESLHLLLLIGGMGQLTRLGSRLGRATKNVAERLRSRGERRGYLALGDWGPSDARAATRLLLRGLSDGGCLHVGTVDLRSVLDCILIGVVRCCCCSRLLANCDVEHVVLERQLSGEPRVST